MTYRKKDFFSHCLTGIVTALISVLAQPLFADTDLDMQRALYREAIEDIRLGRTEEAEAKIPSLQGYVLYPYFELELLKSDITGLSSETIDTYLKQYQDTVVGRKIRAAWLYSLRQQQQWPEFLRYAGGKAPYGMQCDFITALNASGAGKQADRETQKLWLTGHSLPKQCDSVLATWLQGLPADKRQRMYWQRAELAIREKQHGLAKYLLDKIPGTEDYQALLDTPNRLYRDGFTLPVDDFSRELVALTLKRLAAVDFEPSSTLWQQLDRRFHFSPAQSHALRDSFARQIIAGDADYVRDWINANDRNFQDPYLTEWRVRLALKDRDWQAAQRFIEALPSKHRQKSDWQYWWARADIEQHQAITPEAQTILRNMATERGYYSFLAADLLNQEYRLGEKRTVNPELIAGIEAYPAVQRARELRWQGDSRAAMAEWKSAMRHLDKPERIAAAQLALDWQWAHAAIVTAIQAGEWDDLVLRFPLAFYPDFSRNAESQNVDLKWVYSIARQESAFAEDARSRVGARGLMQLMPATAHTISRQMGQPTPGVSDLEVPEINIEMGTFYLARLLEEFEGNRILATAAYNAGPARIRKVLARQQESMPADIWIENLPYGETREYIKNVMAFSVVYGIKLESSKPILASHERKISPLPQIDR